MSQEKKTPQLLYLFQDDDMFLAGKQHTLNFLSFQLHLIHFMSGRNLIIG